MSIPTRKSFYLFSLFLIPFGLAKALENPLEVLLDKQEKQSFSHQCPYHEAGMNYFPESTQMNLSIMEGNLKERKIYPSSQCHPHKQLNFGVLVNNPYFQIYRSSGLGRKGLKELEKHLNGVKQPETLPATIIYLNHYAYGDVSEKVVNYFIRGFNRFTERPNYPYYDFAKEQEKAKIFPLSKKKFEFFHPAGSAEENVYLHGKNPLSDLLVSKNFSDKKSKSKEDQEDAEEKNIISRGGRDNLYHVLEKILTQAKPVLFHCKGGIHRTGMTALMVRYLQGEDWTKPFSDAEGTPQILSATAKTNGRPSMAQLQNPAEYEYFLHNSHNFRQENLLAIKNLAKDARFQCLKKQFQAYLLVGEHQEKNKCQIPSPAHTHSLPPQLLSPAEFASKAAHWVTDCRIQHAKETSILMHLDYLEAALKKRHSKIRLYENGLSVSKEDKDKESDKSSKNYLKETADFLVDLEQDILQYEKDSQNSTISKRWNHLLHKLLKKDPSIKKAIRDLSR